LIRETWKHLGTPYRYGGVNPSGFDCSGLVHYVHRKVGIDTPRTTAAQRRRAQKVTLNALQTGDLLFFSINGGKGRHVAIYEGNGVFIHAPSSGKLVSRASLNDPYWRTRIVGAGSYF
jgi:cell wall-associated NlpC family hydrolase